MPNLKKNCTFRNGSKKKSARSASAQRIFESAPSPGLISKLIISAFRMMLPRCFLHDGCQESFKLNDPFL